MSARDRIGILARLALSKGSSASDDQLDTYVDLTNDVPVDLLREGCRKLALAATFGMPSVGDIRLACDAVQRDQIAKVKELPALYDEEADRRGWVHCRRCNDDPAAWLPTMHCQGSGAGWQEARNVTLPISTCGRQKSHGPHTFTERCTCHQEAWRNERRMQAYGENIRESARTR